ncbi:MAG: VWA domain-containing protein [Syntrophomonadaceae bacterium]|nr:VWA domain-containing protein [Syntrophomonadaceae bacterium]MDD3889821.1 VWA domain-containing protein [Syntrophomonadaceae bacterium]MDD4549797.1 VWA domain-containing protein [Syntrophomonadaceae bacterium]
MLGEDTNVDKAASVGNYLNLYFGQDQGVRLGESTVVSRKAHARMPEKRVKGQIKILVNRDAGKQFLDFVDVDQVVHIDVFHQPGAIDPRDVATVIFRALDEHFLQKDPQLQYAEDERFKMVNEYAHKIYIVTNQGKGTLYDLFQDVVAPFRESDEGWDHVHLLARLNRAEYYLVYVITEQVEQVIIASGTRLSKVRNIVHGNEKQQQDSYAGYLKLPWKSFKGQQGYQLPDKEYVNQLILKLAEKFGGVDEIEEFMQNYATNIFKRRGIDQQKKRWGDVEHDIEQLEELGLIKNTPLGKVLSKQGIKIKDYVINHKCELETEIRRNTRRIPAGGSGRYKKIGKVDHKAASIEYTNHQKTINNSGNSWSGDLAVPETIIQARKNSFLRGDERFTIQKEDLHFYKKKKYVPIDVCLLIDASGSMAGDKRQAACYLAEHLLLTGKEKVAVVTFQERSSKVIVPFTRNQHTLKKGLATIYPAGLTPMADGIMTAVNLIKNTSVRNPLLVMITDGIPNIPLWTLDARADGLEAAARIPENKMRFICIGVESNRFYLEKVVSKADGALYLVDDLNKDNLINIVRCEKKAMIGDSKEMTLK